MQAWISAGAVVPNTTPGGIFFARGQTGPDAMFQRVVGSTDQGSGANVGSEYQYDLNGKLRVGSNWDIGAYSVSAAPGSRWVSGAWKGAGMVR